jgi:uncharacterized membrane protein YdbT with pleckstrin-like domain
MSYVDSNLMTGEAVVFRGKVHWAIYIRSSLFLVVSIIFGIGASSSGEEGPKALLALVAFVIGFAAVCGLVSAFINAMTAEYAVTNKRIFLKSGFIRRDVTETVLAKVESVSVKQSILGRILNYGGIVSTGTGGSAKGFNYYENPVGFKQAVQQQIELQRKSA